MDNFCIEIVKNLLIESRQMTLKIGENDNRIIDEAGYFNRKVAGRGELVSLLKEKINKCKTEPFMMLRVSNTECKICGQFLEKTSGIREHYAKREVDWLLRTSGFFCDDERDIDRFAEMSLKGISLCDIFLCWFPMFINVLGNYVAPDSFLARWNFMDYDVDMGSWVRSLEGKKVLVVSPFSKSIEHQYSRKHLLCKYKSNELPDFDLKTYQMIQTQCNNRSGFKTWFNAYQHVVDDVLAMDFDIAIVGAGAYAVPLCAEIKKSGRSVLDTCSFTPLLFGIAGKRHIEQGWVEKMGTKAWIRPLEAPPSYADRIEDGCYW